MEKPSGGTPEQEQAPAQKEEQTQPRLSADFFQDLLRLPSCKTIGICDDCGRCER